MELPRITLVTPSFNQGAFITETVESVLAQNYPNLEYIIQDGGSTDDTLARLQPYAALPFVRIFSQPDKGQADAINHGFARADGQIFGFLNSDDLLLPGALHRVAREINPQAGRQVVMGRCLFIDAQGRRSGLEHPSFFRGHTGVLEIWRGHGLPQPSTFFTAQAWQAAGPMRLDAYHLDYDFFCRLSRLYRFYLIDEILSLYRLHDNSKTVQMSEQERMRDSIAISRRYWGRGPRAWKLQTSLWLWRFDRCGRARQRMKAALQQFKDRLWLPALGNGLLGAALAPEVAFFSLAFPRLRAFLPVLEFLWRSLLRPAAYPQTLAYRSWRRLFEDGWAPPRVEILLPEELLSARNLTLQGYADLTYLPGPLNLSLLLNAQPLQQVTLSQTGPFQVSFALPVDFRPGQSLTVQASAAFFPHQFTRGGDYRPLSWKFSGFSR